MQPPTVNGVAILLAAIEEEAAHHADAADPLQAAAEALTMRELLVQRMRELGLDECDDNAIDTLLEREIQIPQAGLEECRRYFAAHPDEFAQGALVEVSHILFAVTPGAPVDRLRQRAEEALFAVQNEPERFGEFARDWSNCPTAAAGGSLGLVSAADCVAEFAQAVFADQTLGVLPRLVNSRYGFHVVRVTRRIAGHMPEFSAVLPHIIARLQARARVAAVRQYLQVLIGQARIEGVNWQGATSPLVQ